MSGRGGICGVGSEDLRGVGFTDGYPGTGRVTGKEVFGRNLRGLRLVRVKKGQEGSELPM